ncbi:TonB-dependent receptor domain-containing protein, partial [Steroidobacter sp.]|uniref:TonB-dependent receptor domain-containing protein n=1 Tax=Steroidobacter sp. TaxID=1978227 RepID=UPI001A5A1EC5
MRKAQSVAIFSLLAAGGVFSTVSTAQSVESAMSRVSDTAEKKLQFNLERQPISEALTALGQQSGLTIIVESSVSRGITAEPLSGSYTANEALQRLLQPVGLKAEYLDGRTVAVRPANSAKRTAISSSERPLRMAQADVASTTGRVDAPEAGLEEIVVTATRRSENLANVPISIAAIGAAEISRRNLVSQTDFLRTVPGVNQIEGGAGASSIVMRGIAVNPTGEGFNLGLTTATFLGEVPLSSGRVGQSDLRLIDIERVEVLRGPQGTQFGSSAIAGTLRYIPAPPELSTVSGNVKAGYSVTRGEGSTNDNIEGVLNLPLIDDVLGVRAVAYRYFDHGYVRNVAASNSTFAAQAAALGVPELAGHGRVGNTTAEGGRIAALLRPSDELSLTLTFVKQKLTQDGKLEVQAFASPTTASSGIYYPAVGGKYDQVRWTFGNTFGRGELQVDDTEIANALLEYDLGWGELLGSVSRSEQAFQNLNDIGLFWGDEQGGNPMVQNYTQASKSTAVETRFTSKFDGPWSVIAGLYYEDSEMLRSGANKFGGTQAQMDLYYPGAPNLNLGQFLVGDNTEQKAGYAEVSYEIVEGLKAIVGARAFRYDIERPTTLDGIGFGGYSYTYYTGTDSGEVYKGTLSYQARENAMVYATFSQGFRLGFPQAPVPANCDLDGDGYIDGLNGVSTRLSAVHPDNLDNFEVGAKLRWSDRVEINAAAFDIKWDGLPVTVFGTCGYNAVINAGQASSRGVELETKVLVVPSLV